MNLRERIGEIVNELHPEYGGYSAGHVKLMKEYTDRILRLVAEEVKRMPLVDDTVLLRVSSWYTKLPIEEARRVLAKAERANIVGQLKGRL